MLDDVLYLPAEIAEHIVDHLADDRDALKACSLVSRAWRPRSLFWLFATYEIVDGRDPADNDMPWRGAAHVHFDAARFLYMVQKKEGRSLFTRLCTTLISSPLDKMWWVLQAALELDHRIKRLVINGAIDTSVLSRCKLHTVRALELRNSGFRDTRSTCKAISYFTELEELVMEGFVWQPLTNMLASDVELAATFPRPCTVRIVTYRDPRLAEKVSTWLNMQRIPIRRIVLEGDHTLQFDMLPVPPATARLVSALDLMHVQLGLVDMASWRLDSVLSALPNIEVLHVSMVLREADYFDFVEPSPVVSLSKALARMTTPPASLRRIGVSVESTSDSYLEHTFVESPHSWHALDAELAASKWTNLRALVLFCASWSGPSSAVSRRLAAAVSAMPQLSASGRITTQSFDARSSHLLPPHRRIPPQYT
ncbi:hypothetical protein EXIGLDRAFT_782516 [Exidia glandulosa HHB12029]|uniref:F-box domain-containing protein n=1 Tax=Exidia glandulosa HHB12029 TaxID=1314781 RepID=A0A166NLW8_EXIGL|nr:hypothetical protein EXIGLDRAFT_782516 [Exidia glandulosa HHB12029]